MTAQDILESARNIDTSERRPIVCPVCGVDITEGAWSTAHAPFDGNSVTNQKCSHFLGSINEMEILMSPTPEEIARAESLVARTNHAEPRLDTYNACTFTYFLFGDTDHATNTLD